MSGQGQEDRRWERVQVAGAAGAATRRTTTPSSDPTEWECHKGHIKKEPLQPDSQSVSQPLHTKHTDHVVRVIRQLATFQTTAFSTPCWFQARQIVYSAENALSRRPHSLPHPHNQTTVRAVQLSDAEVAAAAGDFLYVYNVYDLAAQPQASGFHSTGA
ncbi:unnamed protein product [Schistocephalus solidus]|uniref:BAH domain-containing protein n=1 Tax=Schistocephalus solidus TaxID=70667 RepID=A0A183SWP3_SCHSO|nr:unnamed protein product [Schistocephalus solidus]